MKCFITADTGGRDSGRFQHGDCRDDQYYRLPVPACRSYRGGPASDGLRLPRRSDHSELRDCHRGNNTNSGYCRSWSG